MAQKSQQDDDIAVDQYGNPLPEITLRSKGGREVVVRDAASLSNLHYGSGFDFAEDGMTYAKALGRMLGDQREQVLVDVPADGSDIVWPQPVLPDAPVADEVDKSEDKGPKGHKGKTD